MTLHKSHSGSRIRSNIVVYTGLIVASLLVVLPFAIILVTSFKSITDAQSWEFSLVGKEDGLTVSNGSVPKCTTINAGSVIAIKLAVLPKKAGQLIPTRIWIYV